MYWNKGKLLRKQEGKDNVLCARWEKNVDFMNVKNVEIVFFSSIDGKDSCPECEAEIDYEIGPDESLEDVLDTAVLLEKIEEPEEVRKNGCTFKSCNYRRDDSWI